MNYLFSLLIGYFLGSIPTAFLVLRYSKGLDITNSGTGNVGAMNSYEVSHSKFLGILVFLIDALKGLLSVYITLLLLPLAFIYPAMALLFAVFAHCYNPWLKFKGGRGLAAAAGGTALLFPALLGVWLILWVAIYFFRKNIIFANVSSSFLSLILVYGSVDIFAKYSYPRIFSAPTLILFVSALFIIIFAKHFDPLLEVFKDKSFLSTKR